MNCLIAAPFYNGVGASQKGRPRKRCKVALQPDCSPQPASDGDPYNTSGFGMFLVSAKSKKSFLTIYKRFCGIKGCRLRAPTSKGRMISCVVGLRHRNKFSIWLSETPALNWHHLSMLSAGWSRARRWMTSLPHGEVTDQWCVILQQRTDSLEDSVDAIL